MKNKSNGYYRFPTVKNSQIAFVAEDDIWKVDIQGGTACRLTTNLGEVSHLSYSPDGKWIAFTGREEGITEIYVIPQEGGISRRLTYLGAFSYVVGWKGAEVVFASTWEQPFRKSFWLYSVDLQGNQVKKLPYGPARSIDFNPQGVVIGRNTGDPARWKRYKGGTAGEIWIDIGPDDNFEKLIELNGNLATPMWIGDRIYFISDHDGIGNIWSCLTDGSDLKQHTKHQHYYARYANSDGENIVYHHGADIYLLKVKENKLDNISIEYRSSYIQRSRKFVDPEKYLEDYDLNKQGSMLSLITRGQAFVMGNWEGAVQQLNEQQGHRVRLVRFLNDGKRMVYMSDRDNLERLEIADLSLNQKITRLENLDVGRPGQIKVSPVADQIILSNHRHEIIWIDLEKQKMEVIDQSKYRPIGGFDWSPHGQWVAYSFAVKHHQSIIKVWKIGQHKTWPVTAPVLHDVNPVFDPQGKYLFFLSYRIFNPVYDQLHFDLNFPKGMKPYMVTLQEETTSPFIPEPRGFKPDEDKSEKEENEKPVEIDLNKITERVIPVPFDESIYQNIQITDKAIFISEVDVEGSLHRDREQITPPAKARLWKYDLKKLEKKVFSEHISDFILSADRSAILIQSGSKLRVLSTEMEPDAVKQDKSNYNRESGWIDLSRIKVSVDPLAEWKQMFKEAWRLQREYYWVEDMSNIDWEKIYDRYFPLVDRIASRSEFSDLIWEMQGELGTSHAYEFGGDYRPKPQYRIGFLGADFEYDEQADAYRIISIINADSWADQHPHPLKRPGVNLTEGMLLHKVAGKKLDVQMNPYRTLINYPHNEVNIQISNADGSKRREVTVHTIDSETPLRYRQWVEKNREYVHQKTDNQVGYIHVPDMGPQGYAEFHRYFLAEFDYPGLIVDVRYNGGGHVSCLLLEKLARKRLGYDLTRWMGYSPYPDESVHGPMVALTNEHAGSDGDIFSHSFKLMKLGKLIGRRTWGGVIGIWPRNWLVDGTITTQPEFSFWFKDVGWGVENYGTDPDIEVDITPQQYNQNIDPQLDRAIEEVLKEIDKNQSLKPDFSKKPKKTLP
ncbi:MAG: hypothetical protein APR63_00895 [Desulfuromonas sp. SDB]|nr:MAG: hypothetical protein APR63_00895 [Desulfuromonas sp. SDB]